MTELFPRIPCYAVGYRDPKTGMWKREFGPASKAECQAAWLDISQKHPTAAVLGPVPCA